MAINVFEEDVIGFAEAAKRLPESTKGKRVHISCLYRWANGGLIGRAGELVRLETVKVGGRVYTSVEALQRFFDRLSDDRPAVAPRVRTSSWAAKGKMKRPRSAVNTARPVLIRCRPSSVLPPPVESPTAVV